MTCVHNANTLKLEQLNKKTVLGSLEIKRGRKMDSSFNFLSNKHASMDVPLKIKKLLKSTVSQKK
jgi:hypothetical protein